MAFLLRFSPRRSRLGWVGLAQPLGHKIGAGASPFFFFIIIIIIIIIIIFRRIVRNADACLKEMGSSFARTPLLFITGE